ncbi:MAG: AEC family transporter [Limisphaerales bacterium]
MLTTITSALVPVFFVMGLGHFAGRKKIVENQHVNSLNTLVMTFALPLSLFIAMAQTPATRLASGAILGLVLTLSMLVLFVITYFLNRHVFGKSSSETAIQSLNVSLPNYASVGLPLLGAVIGPESATSVSVAIAAGTVIMSPLTLIVLDGQTVGAKNVSSPRRIALAFLHAVRKPVVVGPVAGVIIALAGHPLPQLAVQTFNLLGQATAGIALFVTGLVLSSQALNFNANVFLGVLLKNIVHPLLVVGIAVLFSMNSHEMHEAILLAAIPSGFFGVLFGLNYGVNSRDADSTLTISSLVSIVTLAVAILLTNGMK